MGNAQLHAVMPPGPDSAESKFLHAIRRAGSFVKGIATEDDAKVLKQPFKGRRIEGQTGKFNAIAVHVEDNGFLSRDDQSSQDSKLGGFPSKELDDPVGIIQGAGINNHWCQFIESDLRTESKFESASSPLVSGVDGVAYFQLQILMNIRLDDLNGPEILQLLREHLQSMYLHSPPESVHALGIEALRKPEITFWTVWQDSELMGCGALKELDAIHGEIKSMRTASAHLRKGVASALMVHILEEARRRSYRRLSLETGSTEPFAPARSLYARFGFRFCSPFADYVEDPFSVFMTREL